MADQVVKTITIRGKTDGVDAATDSLKKLAAAQGAVASVSDTSSKSSLSLEQAYQRQTLRLDTAARQQAAFTREANIANGALAQGIITTQEHAARMDLLNAKYGQGSIVSQAFGKSLSGVQGQLVGMAAGFGPVGVFLSSLGPWGIAAGAGLALVSSALHFIAEESTRMGEKSIALQQFKEVTGLTVNEIGSLRQAGASLGLEGERVAQGFERLTGQLLDARRASGSLYDDVRLVNGELAEELRQTTTTADAINVLARAYAQATDQATKAAIARAAFGGRGGAMLGPVLGQVADAGGIQAMASNMARLNDATDAQTKRWAEMQAKIDETSKRAKNILAAIFTEEGLRAQLKAAETEERLARAAKDLADQQSGLTFFQRLDVERTRGSAGGVVPGGNDAGAAALAARFRLTNQFNAGVSKTDLQSWIDLGAAFNGTSQKGKVLDKTLQDLQNEAAAGAKLDRERIGLLGQAATYEDQRKARLSELLSALRDNRMTQDDYNRAVAAENASVNLQTLQARIGMLGSLASVEEQVRAVRERANQERQKGIQLSNDEIAAIARETALRAESAKLQTQAQFGIFDATRQNANAQFELQTLIDQKAIRSAEDYAAVWAVLAKRMRETSEQAQVARSNLPQLTQMMLDAGNGWKQLDTAATSTLNGLNSNLLDFETGVKSGGDAMKDFEKIFIRSLLNMMNQMLIIQPIAAGLKSALGLGASFLGIGGGAAGIAPDGSVIKAHSGGVVGHDSFASAYVHPAYFEGASRFAMGGIAGLGPDEVPIIAHRDEEIIRPDDPRHRWNGGGGDLNLKQEITFKIDGAVGKGEIVGMIQAGMKIAKQQGAALALAAMPERQAQARSLGS